MGKRLLAAFILAAGGLLAVFIVGGCGSSDTTTQQQPAANPLSSTKAADDLNAKLDELKKKNLTVEAVVDGKSQGKWSQDGKGSWRSDEANNPNSYTIYNADQKKGWNVSGNTATEVDPNMMQVYELGSPLTIMAAYSSFANLPKTGGTDDTWEWNVPGVGSLTIEFKGPDGLMSKITSSGSGIRGDNTTSTIELKYTNVGSVPASTFQLPSNVTVSPSPLGGLGTGTTGVTVPSGVTIPSGVNIPSSGSY